MAEKEKGRGVYNGPDSTLNLTLRELCKNKYPKAPMNWSNMVKIMWEENDGTDHIFQTLTLRSRATNHAPQQMSGQKFLHNDVRDIKRIFVLMCKTLLLTDYKLFYHHNR